MYPTARRRTGRRHLARVAFAFGKNGPGLRVWGTGIWPGPCSVGDESMAKRYASDRTMLARSWRGWLVLARNQCRKQSAAPRPSGASTINPFSRARRSGCHMVAHPTVASPSAAAQVLPKHGGTAVWVRPNTRFAVQPDQRKTAPVLARATALIQRPASPT
jgi:hypothetical protein